MRVEVYRNLHTGTFSVRDLQGPLKGKVTSHPTLVILDVAKFVVQPAGRDKVRREGRKNVHAFVRGNLLGKATNHTPYDVNRNQEFRQATYNPYVYDTFVDWETGDPVLLADMVVLDIHSGLWYAGDTV